MWIHEAASGQINVLLISDTMRNLPRKLRLVVWIIAVIGALPGQVIWVEWIRHSRSARAGPEFETGYLIVVGCLGVIAGLLWTTPGNAIRLPRWISEFAILGGIAALSLPGLEFLPITIARALFAIPALILLRVRAVSPWWAVPVLWFPARGF